MLLPACPWACVWWTKAEPGSPASILWTSPQKSWPKVPGDTHLESWAAFVWVSSCRDLSSQSHMTSSQLRARDWEQTDAPEKAFSHPFCYLTNSVQKLWGLSHVSRWAPSPAPQWPSRTCPPHRLPLDVLLTSLTPQRCHLPSVPSSLPLWFQWIQWVLFLAKASHSTLPWLHFPHFASCHVFLAAPNTWSMNMLELLLS